MVRAATAGRVPRPSADATRERILAAALDLFSKLSFDGATTREIASRLYLSPGTVRNYLSTAVGKTGARNRIDAIRIASDSGWL